MENHPILFLRSFALLILAGNKQSNHIIQYVNIIIFGRGIDCNTLKIQPVNLIPGVYGIRI